MSHLTACNILQPVWACTFGGGRGRTVRTASMLTSTNKMSRSPFFMNLEDNDQSPHPRRQGTF